MRAGSFQVDEIGAAGSSLSGARGKIKKTQERFIAAQTDPFAGSEREKKKRRRVPL
jgi:hypothetical protein